MENYNILKILGDGGGGIAWLAEHKVTHEKYVIKKIFPSLKNDEQIEKECILKTLDHPNIVKFIDYFKCKDSIGFTEFYIVMEYAEGGDLAKKIKSFNNLKKPMPGSDILDYFVQISLAIKYLHDRKIIHRDIKPSNIFLTKDNTIKLGDFGEVRVLENTYQSCQTQAGTPIYMSPELANSCSYDFKTDIWSLGCILYEMCTLHKPAFPLESNFQKQCEQIKKCEYTIPFKEHRKEIYDLINKMLSVDPTERPTIYGILSLPFIKERIDSLVKRGIIDEKILKLEMDHTILHGFTPIMDLPNDKYHMKVLFVGYHCVGKTTLIERFVNGVFNDEILPTIGTRCYRKELKVDSFLMDIEVWDTPSQGTYLNINNMHLDGVNTYVIIFSVCDRCSFNDVKKCYDEIIKKDKNATIFLCGNQCDYENRTVSVNEGKHLAKVLNVEYFETSAVLGAKVETMFDAIARKYLMQLKKKFDMQKEGKEEETSSCVIC
ncbi:CAMK family protein kinase [Histomonas meleagridis]|uniref:CAMK family protein kinase n=1 Tax=Histomonas meleagridis TaxID=135588 RepID=UPI00355A197E|nr:CAMK family protein kinase [Histomonas meleagridis]KAH0800374.1 CAMK family protein kinase [Histomonas meleagridis]